MSANSAVGLAFQCRREGVFLLLLFLNLIANAQLASATCYFPDGSIAATDTPCSSDGASTCCGNGYACLSNRICMATGDEAQKPAASLYVRGSCTDQSWQDASCPLFCIGSNDLLSGGMGVAKCPNTSLDEYYCINSGYSSVNCTTEFNVFEFSGTPSALTTIGVIGKATTTLSIATSPTTSPTTFSIAIVTTSSPSNSVITVSTAVLPSTASTSILSATPSAVTTPVATSQPRPSDNSVAIGVGVAVPCGLIIAGLLGFIIFRRRKSKRTTASDVKGPQYYTDGQPPTYYSGAVKQELDGNAVKQTGRMTMTNRYELPSAQQ